MPMSLRANGMIALTTLGERLPHQYQCADALLAGRE